MLSITQDMKESQGLNEAKWYEAIVIENNDHKKHPDKMMMGRIQARVSELFQGISDKDLPWALPFWAHCDGAHALSGFFSVPKKGTKVLLKFQGANPSFPIYHGFHTDVLTQMQEIKHHYPNRVVARLQNKALVIVDTEDNVLYLRNPGNTKIYIDGNVELEINGNVDELIHGNVRRRIKGNLDEEVDGNRHYHTVGKHVESVEKTTQVYGGLDMLYESGQNVKIESGVFILENCDNKEGNPGKAKYPVFHKWPGVPGSAKGCNKRPKQTKATCAQPCPELPKDDKPPNVNPQISVDPEQEPESSSMGSKEFNNMELTGGTHLRVSNCGGGG